MRDSHDHYRRHVRAPHRTTISLEPLFWDAIDYLAAKAGTSWRQWAEAELADKPAGHNAASWLRVRCLTACRAHHVRIAGGQKAEGHPTP